MTTIVTDEHESLKVFHYKDCDNQSSDEIKEMRGIIKENNMVVCKSFPFTPEYTTEQISEMPVFPNESIKWYESHEGTLLRLWEHNGVWHLSTHRKINSFLSKWGGKSSYGELFLQFLQRTKNMWNKSSWADDEEEEQSSTTDLFASFCKLCDKNYIYVFLCRNTDSNRIVVKGYSEPECFCLGTFHRPSNFTYKLPPKTFPIKMPAQITTTTLSEYVMSSIDPLKLQGLIGITSSGKMVKLVHPKYYLFEQLRANASSLEFRYLELLHQPVQRQMFTELYSEHQSLFTEVDQIIDSICTNIFKKYLQRYIHKQVAVLPNYQFTISKGLHQRYISKEINKVTPDIIQDTVFHLPTKELYACVKQFQKTQKKHGNGNFVDETNKQAILVHRV